MQILLHISELQKLFVKIEELGEKIVTSLSKHDMVNYRRSVSDFTRIVKEYLAQDEQDLNLSYTEQQNYLAVFREIDKQLLLLKELVLAGQDHRSIVTTVDHIRSMILDLCS